MANNPKLPLRNAKGTVRLEGHVKAVGRLVAPYPEETQGSWDNRDSAAQTLCVECTPFVQV